MPLAVLIAFAVGGVTGLRTFAALAVLFYARRDWWSVLFGVALLGELIADLLPKTPGRTSVGPMLGRVLIGGYCAAVVGMRGGLPFWPGAICGAIGAFVFAHVGFVWRTRVAPSINLPPVAAALLEDAVAIGGAIALIGL